LSGWSWNELIDWHSVIHRLIVFSWCSFKTTKVIFSIYLCFLLGFAHIASTIWSPDLHLQVGRVIGSRCPFTGATFCCESFCFLVHQKPLLLSDSLINQSVQIFVYWQEG